MLWSIMSSSEKRVYDLNVQCLTQISFFEHMNPPLGTSTPGTAPWPPPHPRAEGLCYIVSAVSPTRTRTPPTVPVKDVLTRAATQRLCALNQAK